MRQSRNDPHQQTLTISAETLRRFLERIFLAAGMDSFNARITAAGVLEADLREHFIQGTDHIYSIVRDLKFGRINGRARPRVLSETTATARIDGDGATGHVAGQFAAELAIRKGRETGVAAAGLVRGGDLFMLGNYVEQIARAGLVGAAFTNSMSRVHPHGGIDPILGTNPIAFGFPLPGSDPLVMDTTTSASALGYVRMATYDNRPIPEGIAIDEAGAPTTDAKRALGGALRPLGGPKGFALGLATALLSGPLVGAIIGAELCEAVASDQPPARGHLFIAIDPAAFGDPAVSLDRTRRYVQEIKGSRKAPGVTEILVPGERSSRARRRSLSEGIKLPASVWRHTVEIARELGVKPPTPSTHGPSGAEDPISQLR